MPPLSRADADAEARRLAARLENLLFGHRPIVIGLFVLATLGFMAGRRRACASTPASPSSCRSSTRTWPTFLKHQQEFGGANRVLVALVARDGDMFTPEFFDALKRATDEVFFLPGVDRGRVQSLFTPNVRYTEVVEDGIAAGNVIPDDFPHDARGPRRPCGATSSRPASSAGWWPTTSRGAIISAELLEVDPDDRASGSTSSRSPSGLETQVRRAVRRRVRARLAGDVHIIGFAKVMGDIAAGAQRVVIFFLGHASC